MDNQSNDIRHKLSDALPATRIAAAHSVGASAEIDEVDALLFAIEKETEEQVVIAILDSLRRVNTHRSLSKLRKAYTKWNGSGVSVAIKQLIDQLEADELQEIIDTARNSNRTTPTRERALRKLLERENDDAYDIAIAALSDPEPGMRCVAAITLAQLGNSSAIQSLKPLLNDPDVEVRFYAAKALVELRDLDGLAFLQEQLLQENSIYRIAALNSLEQVWNDQINDLTPFIHALSDTDSEVRLTAITHLTSLAGPEIELHLLTAICDSDERVATIAVNHLEDIYQIEIDDLLNRKAKSRDTAVRQAALQAKECIVQRSG